MTTGRAIEARHVTVRYGRLEVLRDVSFAANFGEFSAILGPNGAGKSTLLKAVAGLVAREGEVCWCGVGLDTLSRRVRAQRVAYVPQRSSLSVAVSVREVVEQGRFAHRRPLGGAAPGDGRAVDRALHAMDVASLEHRAYTELSGGEQRRVLLARALATEARIILLDEPTESLDIRHTLDLYERLRELANGGYAIVSVLHDLDAARSHADHAVLLAEGRIVYQGSPEEVIATATVRRVYAVELVESAALGFRKASGES